MKAFHVYMVRCSDGTHYTGMTSNLEQRIAQHERGYFAGSYTARRRAVDFVFAEAFSNAEDAISAEKRVQKWSQEKKQKLISGEWNLGGKAQRT